MGGSGSRQPSQPQMRASSVITANFVLQGHRASSGWSARAILGFPALLVPEQKVVLDDDPVRARGLARERLAVYLTLPNYVGNLLRLGFTDDDVSGSGTDRLVDALVAWGDADRIADRVRAHWDAGADQVALHVLGSRGADPTPTVTAVIDALGGAGALVP